MSLFTQPTVTPAILGGVDHDRDFLRSLAHHEAGHAVIALVLGVTVHYATTWARNKDESGGHVSHAPYNRMTIEAALLITLAGPSAQQRYFPFEQWFESYIDDPVEDPIGRFDIETARTLLATLRGSDYFPDPSMVDLSPWRARADRMVALHWRWICAVAEALVQRRQLPGDAIASMNPSHVFQNRRKTQ